MLDFPARRLRGRRGRLCERLRMHELPVEIYPAPSLILRQRAFGSKPIARCYIGIRREETPPFFHAAAVVVTPIAPPGVALRMIVPMAGTMAATIMMPRNETTWMEQVESIRVCPGGEAYFLSVEIELRIVRHLFDQCPGAKKKMRRQKASRRRRIFFRWRGSVGTDICNPVAVEMREMKGANRGVPCEMDHSVLKVVVGQIRGEHRLRCAASRDFQPERLIPARHKTVMGIELKIPLLPVIVLLHPRAGPARTVTFTRTTMIEDEVGAIWERRPGKRLVLLIEYCDR